MFSKTKLKAMRILLDYIPVVGVKSFKNGKLALATTEGEDFKRALLVFG